LVNNSQKLGFDSWNCGAIKLVLFKFGQGDS